MFAIQSLPSNPVNEIVHQYKDVGLLVFADQGKTIKVRVSFSDDADNQESLTSVATDAVAAKPNSRATGAPTIDGTARGGRDAHGPHQRHRPTRTG